MMRRTILLILLLLGLSAFGYYAVMETTWFHVKQVLLTQSASHIRPADLEKLMGHNLVTSPKSQFSEILDDIPYVQSYQIYRQLPATLRLEIVERLEFAAIKHHDLFVIVDADGIVLDIRPEAGDLLQLEGFQFDSVHLGKPLNSTQKDVMAHAIQLILLLKQNVTYPFSVSYQKGIEVKLTDGLKARFGDGDDLNNKFTAYMTIYGDLQTKGITEGIIDVSKKDYYIYKPIAD